MIRLSFRPLVAAIAIAVAVGVAFAGSARADIVIDTFNETPQVNYQIGLLNSSPYAAPSVLLGNGLTRDLSVVVASPAVPNFNSASGTIGNGTFSINTDNISTAFATINYSGFGAGTSDFSAGNSIQLDFTNLNPGNTSTGVAPDMPITVEIQTASGTLSHTVSAVGGPSFAASLLFSDFTGTGDLSNVTGLQVTLNGGPGGRIAADFELDNVVVPTNAVPAPPAFALVLAAVPVLSLRRWKAKQAA